VDEEFRSGFGRGLTVVIGVAAVFALVLITATGGAMDAALTLPWLALVVTCCWAVFWRPLVRVSDAGVRLVNVTRTIDVPWPALREVHTRYALTLVTAYGSFAAWAAPAPTAGTALRSSMKFRPSDTPAAGREVVAVSVGDLPGSASGDAAAAVRRRWERLRVAGHLDDPRLEFERLPVRWHWRTGVGVAALAVVSGATLFLG
jgi:hypothetical protein